MGVSRRLRGTVIEWSAEQPTQPESWGNTVVLNILVQVPVPMATVGLECIVHGVIGQLGRRAA